MTALTNIAAYDCDEFVVQYDCVLTKYPNSDLAGFIWPSAQGNRLGF